MKVYSESRTELQNPLFAILQELKKYPRKLAIAVNTEGHWIRVLNKGALLTVEICLLYWLLSNQF